MEPYDVAGNIREAHCSPRHPTLFEPSYVECRAKWHPMTWRAMSARTYLQNPTDDGFLLLHIGLLREYLAGGSLRTITRPTLTRSSPPPRVCMSSHPEGGVMLQSRFECLFSTTLLPGPGVPLHRRRATVRVRLRAHHRRLRSAGDARGQGQFIMF